MKLLSVQELQFGLIDSKNELETTFILKFDENFPQLHYSLVNQKLSSQSISTDLQSITYVSCLILKFGILDSVTFVQSLHILGMLKHHFFFF